MQTYNFKPIRSTNTFLGVTFEFIRVTEEDGEEDREPYILNGYFAEMHVRRTYESRTILIRKDTDEGEAGGLTISGNTLIVDKYNVTLPPNTYVYDIRITTPDGDLFTRIGGILPVLPVSTRE